MAEPGVPTMEGSYAQNIKMRTRSFGPAEREARIPSWLKTVNRQSVALTRLKVQRLWRKRECPSLGKVVAHII